jgi:hypothetical protein
MTARSPDSVRADVLDRMERHDRALRLAITGAAAIEALLLALVLWLADLKDRTHVLILVTSVLSYSIVALGLAALGAHVSRALSGLAAALDDRSPH